MSKWYHKILQNIKDHPPDYGDGDAQSILEMLYTTYHQYNRMDTDEIKRDFEQLYAEMTGISLKDMDGILDTACRLCTDHEKAGFVTGVKIGVKLADELQ